MIHLSVNSHPSKYSGNSTGSPSHELLIVKSGTLPLGLQYQAIRCEVYKFFSLIHTISNVTFYSHKMWR